MGWDAGKILDLKARGPEFDTQNPCKNGERYNGAHLIAVLWKRLASWVRWLASLAYLRDLDPWEIVLNEWEDGKKGYALNSTYTHVHTYIQKYKLP